MERWKGVVQTLESGRKAFERRDWDEAWHTLTELDKDGDLSPQDLELLADAAWWAGHPDEAIDALERAHSGYVKSGDNTEGARVALLLAYFAVRRLAFSIAGGWKAKAMRLLEGQPESPAHAFAKLLEVADAVLRRVDIEDSIRLADETIDLARRTNNRDAENEALAMKGMALLYGGKWQEGLVLLDEASSMAMGGNLSLRAASNVYCLTISACRSMADFGRAGEWTEEADRWMSEHSVNGYPGVCRVHRAELKRLKGAWGEAEVEALGACEELERFRIFDGVGMAHYEVGEIRLLMGDLAGAEEKFKKAYEFGLEPQPGMSLLMLARGDTDGAFNAMKRSLASEEPGLRHGILGRARLLPGQVQVALAAGELGAARAAAAELAGVAEDFDRPAFEAMSSTARGEIALHDGDPVAAIVALDRAWRLWRDLEFPYETARARMLLGRAYLLGEDESRARLELGAARSTFERLGATPDVRRVDDLIYELARPDEPRSRVTKTFMFTDIVSSTDLIGMIGDAAWASLLSWHDRELRAAFATHRGTEVSHTGDGFFVAFDTPTDGVEAAVAIQRRLGEHRREHGFAPSVRIGLHTAEASVDGVAYRGQGVHAAARVGATAGADEIVVSAATVEGAGVLRFPVSEARVAELKGIKEPVPVHLVDWR